MLSDAIYSFLSGSSDVQALVGTPTTRPDSSTGIFPGQAPDEPAMPYVVYFQISGDPLAETLLGDGSLFSEHWRVSAYGTTYRNAKKLAGVVKRVMLKMRGEFDAAPSLPAAYVSGVYYRGEGDLSEALLHGTIYGSHLELQIVWKDPDTPVISFVR